MKLLGFKTTVAICAFLFSLLADALSQTTEQAIIVPIKLSGRGAAQTNDLNETAYMSVSIGSYNGPVSVSGGGNGVPDIPFNFGTEIATALLEPGKIYNVSGYTSYNAFVSAVHITPPPGFSVEIDGWERTAVTFSGSHQVRIIPDNLSFSGRAGVATSIKSGRIYWQVALGNLKSGSSAGALTIVDAARSDWTSLFTPAGISYMSSSSEVLVYRPNGAIRQVSASEAFVDVYVLSATSYELRFYHPTQVTGSNYPKTLTGLPFISYKIERDTTDTKLKITSTTRTLTSATDTTTSPARTAITTLERTGSYPDFVWKLKDWTTSGSQCLNEEVRTWSTDGNGGHIENLKVVSPYSSTPAYQTTSVHTNFNWGDSLTNYTLGVTNPHTTAYDFYGSNIDVGRYAMLRSVETSGGGWTAYEYFADSDSTRYGTLKKVFRPYKNSPATVSFNESQGEVTIYDYSADAFGMLRRPKSVETKVNGITANKFEVIYTNEVTNSKNLVVATRLDYADNNSTTLTTVSKYYREDTGDEFFRNKLHSVERPDGTKDVYARQRGTLSGTTFTPDVNGESARRITIRGLSANASTGNAITQIFTNYQVDNCKLISSKSTMERATFDKYARVARNETLLWNGASWVSLNITDYEYNLSNLLTKRTQSNGAIWEASYAGELKQWERDESGIKVSYEYDAAGRVFRAIKEGISPTPDLITEYTYDPANNITRKETYPRGGSERIGESWTFDQAGRLSASSGAGVGETTYSYSPSTRQKTTTLPSASAAIETYFLDGQLSTLSGTAAPNEFYDYGVESDGRSYQKINIGSETSARWQKTWTDWLGRGKRTERPGAPGQSTYYEEQIYVGAFLKKTTRMGYAATLYAYDSIGQISKTGLDLNNNDELDLASTDRIVGTDNWCAFENNAWWSATRSYTYPHNNSGTEVTLDSTKTRLTGFSGNLRAESKTTDQEGNTYTKTINVDRTNRTVTQTTTLPGHSNPLIETTINGLPTSVVQPDGLTYTQGYDNLSRPSNASDPRTGTSTTSYYAGTQFVSKQIDATGNQVVSYGYDSSGRIKWSQNAENHTTIVDYNSFGQVTHSWGDAAHPASYQYNNLGELNSLYTYQNENGWHATSWPGGTATSTTTWTHDPASGLLTQKKDAENRFVDYDYNERGQVHHRYWMRTLSASTTERVTSTFGYDLLTGELTSKTYNDGTTSIGASYGRTGQIESITDATGTRDFVYNSTIPWRLDAEALDASFYQNRVLTQIRDAVTTSTGTGYNSYVTGSIKGTPSGYNLGTLGQPSQDLSVNHVYANSGRYVGARASSQGGTVRDFLYTYTASSALIAGLSSGSYSVAYAYEANRDLKTVVDNKWSTTSKTRYDYQYNRLGQRSSNTQSGQLFNDYGSGGTSQKYSYNPRGELTTAIGYLGAAQNETTLLPGRFFQFTYDAAGNRKSINHTGVPGLEDLFDINKLNQIEGRENNLLHVAGTVTESANIIVNSQSTGRKGRFWSAELLANNENGPSSELISTVAGISLPGNTSYIRSDSRFGFVSPGYETMTYDLDGNLTSDGRWLYTWDAENQLTSMETRSSALIPNGPARTKLEFAYDYLGRRVQKKVFAWNGSAWSQSYERRFIYDGWNPISEQDASGAMKRSFTWGLDIAQSLNATGGVGALLQLTDHEAGQTYLPTYDGNGNVTALLNVADGTAAAIYEYNAFGEPLRAEGNYAQQNPFRFSTKYTDKETGLVYYGHRYYSPKQGRFINRDPIEEEGGMNLYGFTGNDGVNRYDILGHSWLTKTLRKATDWVNKMWDQVETWIEKVTDSNVQGGGEASYNANGGGVSVGAPGSGYQPRNPNNGNRLVDGGNGVLIDVTTGKSTKVDYAWGSSPGYITVSAPGFEAAHHRLQTLYGGKPWLMGNPAVVSLVEDFGFTADTAKKAVDVWGDNAPMMAAGMVGAESAKGIVKEVGRDTAINLAMVPVGAAAGRIIGYGFRALRPFFAESTAIESFLAAEGAGSNIVYRALNAADAEALAAGRSLTARAPSGTLTAAEHVANVNPAGSPWISTTRNLDIARAYNATGRYGIVRIDLSKVRSFQTEVWRTAPRLKIPEGFAYHRSIWAQEVTIFQEIPASAITR